LEENEVKKIAIAKRGCWVELNPARIDCLIKNGALLQRHQSWEEWEVNNRTNDILIHCIENNAELFNEYMIMEYDDSLFEADVYLEPYGPYTTSYCTVRTPYEAVELKCNDFEVMVQMFFNNHNFTALSNLINGIIDSRMWCVCGIQVHVDDIFTCKTKDVLQDVDSWHAAMELYQQRLALGYKYCYDHVYELHRSNTIAD
jgi:hypothetical protein